MSSQLDYFPIERNRYFYGKLLSVRDFETEQRYTRSKEQLMNRLVLGAGVVCGLSVMASNESTLLIESGLALDYHGRMVTVEEPLLRKLEMIEGSEQLRGHDSAWLCLAYQESDMEPVNAAGSVVGESIQYNMTRESSRLYLTADPPAYRSLLEAEGRENTALIYDGDDLTLVLSTPAAVCAGEEFMLELLLIKSEKTPPVRFRLEGESALIESEGGVSALEFQEDPREKRCVYTISFPLKARQISTTESALFPSGGSLDLQIGSRNFKSFVGLDARIRVCQSAEQLKRWQESADTLERHLLGGNMPIYLAKLELIHSAGSLFIGSVTNLPFRQKIKSEEKIAAQSGIQTVETHVRTLEYWQQPDVQASYQPSSGALRLDFGMPTPEQYDYTVSHGTVVVDLPSGLRVNGKVYSEEIEHGLGAGSVDVRLSVEFADRKENEEPALVFGNSEIFRGKTTPSSPPWVEVGAVVYPERGTMRIGLWLHDMVEGNRMTIHYYAQKPERDTSRLMSKQQVSVSVTPEFTRAEHGETRQFYAEVSGSTEKGVTWSVVEKNGGVIDENGVYQAPEISGTYEIVAVSKADESVSASAFIIVE